VLLISLLMIRWPMVWLSSHLIYLCCVHNSLLEMDPDARLAAVAVHYEELMTAVCNADSTGVQQVCL
jgi:hypothetical protein